MNLMEVSAQIEDEGEFIHYYLRERRHSFVLPNEYGDDEELVSCSKVL